MKNLIKQFYTEGFATTFYQKPVKFIKKKIKNKNISKIFIFLIKVLYTLIFVTLAIIILCKKLPF